MGRTTLGESDEVRKEKHRCEIQGNRTNSMAHKRFRMTLEACRWGIGACDAFMDVL